MSALLLRWTWRDFRSRWLQIIATALILAMGVGAFAGVGGLREWRETSADRSFAALRAHDLRVDLAAGARVRAGTLRSAVAGLGGTVAAAEERLVVPTQIEAAGPVMVPARVVGVPLRRGGQPVDAIAARGGRALTPADARREVALLDWSFARRHELPAAGRVRIAGLGTVPYVGKALSPQYFLIVDESGMSGAESGLAVLYMPLAAAQRAARAPGTVNQLVVRLAPGADPAAVERALREAVPGVEFTRAAEEPARRLIYRDARNDQKIYLALSILILVGAAFAAFNLISRVVQAQRREIGIGMALGAEPRLLAIRPLALGVQIAVLGLALGVPVGIALSEFIKDLLKDFFPLPVYASTFPAELYAAGSALAIVIPLAAAALPVRHAVGVPPVEAIRTGHSAASGGGATALLRRLTLPGRGLAQLPLRNLMRTPRRTLLTLLGLGAVITAVVAVLGMVDAIGGTADRQEAEVLRRAPDRLLVTLTGFERPDGPSARRVVAAPGVTAVEPSLTVGAQVRGQEAAIDVALSFVPQRAIWRPSVVEGRATADGILLARKAADDLGVRVGDEIVLTHPRRAGGAIALDRTRVRVAGIHGNPVRAFAYLDLRRAGSLGLGGIANGMTVLARPGGSVERELFGRPGIASVRAAAADAQALQTAVEAFRGAIQIVAVLTLLLALLVAFTSTSVSLDERRREYATMFAFGLPPRSGLRVAMLESLVTGILGTAVGLALGVAMVGWIVGSLLPEVMPDLGAEVTITGGTVALTLALGVLAVAVAPLLGFRRLRRMDLPSALRVVE